MMDGSGMIHEGRTGEQELDKRARGNFFFFSTNSRKFCGVDDKDLNSGNPSSWEAEVIGL